jgi:amino acid permease
MAGLSFVVTALVIIASYMIYLVVARLLLSPLSRFPGPKLAALSNWYEFYYDVLQQGQFTAHIQKLHDKYGMPALSFVILTFPCSYLVNCMVRDF